ncbi:MAG: LacI family DNA-binding transcriptional regulator [Phycisphaeraceae bacterium]|nr:LacI family DNA-binding transcriptional regulator [Phycisphaeraceae bacterium]
MVTLKQIAEELHLGVSTVSRVLHSDDPRYNAETRQRVRDAARRLGYLPNHVARSMVRGKTFTIGVIGYTSPDMAAGQRMHAMASAIDAAGYKMLYVSRTAGDMDTERRLIDDLMARQVDGLLIGTDVYCAIDAYEALSARRVPMVLTGHLRELSKFTLVRMNSESGMYDLTRHLLDLGHRRIAYVVGSEVHFYRVHRISGFRKAMAEVGAEIQPQWIMDQMPGRTGEAALFTRTVLQASPRPTAILYNNDELAFAGMQEIMRLGLRIPQDVSVAGFNDVQLAQLTWPPLTTVRQPSDEFASKCVELLVEQIDAGHALPARQVLVPTQLIARQSTGPVPA